MYIIHIYKDIDIDIDIYIGREREDANVAHADLLSDHMNHERRRDF